MQGEFYSYHYFVSFKMVKKLEFEPFDCVSELFVVVYLILEVLLAIKQIENGALHLLFDFIEEFFVESDQYLLHFVVRCAQALVLRTETEYKHAVL